MRKEVQEYYEWVEDYMTDPRNAYKCEGCPANMGGTVHLPCREKYCHIETYKIKEEEK